MLFKGWNYIEKKNVFEKLIKSTPQMITHKYWHADKTIEIYHLFSFSLPIHRKSAFYQQFKSAKKILLSLNISTAHKEASLSAKKIFVVIEHISDINMHCVSE